VSRAIRPIACRVAVDPPFAFVPATLPISAVAPVAANVSEVTPARTVKDSGEPVKANATVVRRESAEPKGPGRSADERLVIGGTRRVSQVLKVAAGASADDAAAFLPRLLCRIRVRPRSRLGRIAMTGRFMAAVGGVCGVVAALLLAGCGGGASKSVATTPPAKAEPAKPTLTISATALKSCLDASGASSQFIDSLGGADRSLAENPVLLAFSATSTWGQSNMKAAYDDGGSGVAVYVLPTGQTARAAG
jgi:hypothetical protein